jgi:hypothetical protein
MAVQFDLLVTSSLDRGECFALRPGRLTPAKKTPRDYYIGECIEVSVLFHALAVLLQQKKSQGLLHRRVDRDECFALHPGRLTPAEKIPGTII